MSEGRTVFQVELRVRELSRAVSFYKSVFDWRIYKAAEDYALVDTGAMPVVPILAWPLRLGAVLGPMLADNPVLDAIRCVDVFDEPTYLEARRELLFDPVSADAHRHRQDGYARRVATLPTGHERLISLL